MYDSSTWGALVRRGYVVVGTDYAGLGNNYTTHKFGSFPAHANDVYYSMLAARKAWFGPKLSKQWVGFGHSQGGGAIWKLAESHLVQKDPSYLGTVAMAPATSIVDMAVDNFFTYTTPGLATIVPLCLSRAKPSSYNSTFASPAMQKRLQLQDRAQSCIYSILGVPADLQQEDMVSREAIAQQLPQFLEWQDETAPARGGARSSAPVLVIQGADDPTVLLPYTVEAFTRSCDAGNSVALTVYPGAGHTSIVQVSEPEWTSWLDARFLGQKLPRSSRSCAFVTAKAVDAQSMTVKYLSSGVSLDG